MDFALSGGGDLLPKWLVMEDQENSVENREKTNSTHEPREFVIRDREKCCLIGLHYRAILGNSTKIP